jgi:hypothetical protein
MFSYKRQIFLQISLQISLPFIVWMEHIATVMMKVGKANSLSNSLFMSF